MAASAAFLKTNFLDSFVVMLRRGGAKTFPPTELDVTPTLADLCCAERYTRLLVQMFNCMVSASKMEQVYANRIVPFVNVLMKQKVPENLFGKVQPPTMSWSKLGAAAKGMTSDGQRAAFMQDWLRISCAYPRLFYDAFVCSSLDSSDAMIVSLLTYIIMRLILPDIGGMVGGRVQVVFASAFLESWATYEGKQFFAYAVRALTCSTCFRFPGLAPSGSFHDLSKFAERSGVSIEGVLQGQRQVTLQQLLNTRRPVMDWLCTSVAQVVACIPLSVKEKEMSVIIWTLVVLAATHRPNISKCWKQWQANAAHCVSGKEFQEALLAQTSTHGTCSAHGQDYCASTKTTSALIRQIRDNHASVVSALASVLVRRQSSLFDGGVFQAMAAAPFVKHGFRFSHIAACLIVAVAVLLGRLRSACGVPAVGIVVDLREFGHKFGLHDGPNLKVFRKTHGAMQPVLQARTWDGGGDLERNADDDDDGDDSDDWLEPGEMPKRQLKRRRSSVGASLSRYLCDKLLSEFGSSIMVKFAVGRQALTRSTQFHLSEICASSTICQAQKWMELQNLCHETKNLRRCGLMHEAGG